MAKTEKLVRLIKFGSKQCGPCQLMAKMKTLEKLVEKHPEIELMLVDIELETPETLDGLDEKAAENERMAGDYEVGSLPTLVFESMDAEPVELYRHESAVSAAELEKITTRVLETATRNKTRAAKRAKTQSA